MAEKRLLLGEGGFWGGGKKVPGICGNGTDISFEKGRLTVKQWKGKKRSHSWGRRNKAYGGEATSAKLFLRGGQIRANKEKKKKNLKDRAVGSEW